MNDYLDNLLKIAVQHNATDIHICVGTKPLLRINTLLRPVEEMERVTSDIPLGIAKEILDDFRYETYISSKVVDTSYSKSELGRFRMNFYMQRGTYAIAIRSLPNIIPDLEELGLPEVVKQMLLKPKGLILITGMTGSGKSTTLASMIQYINKTRAVHITTIEDPIEYLHRHQSSLVTQKEIGNDSLNYASALNSTLREDPDVIMLGEMRDKETIKNALTGAETGHLLLSTLHTNSSVKSIDRILDSFNNEAQAQARKQLATTIEGIISQQLIPSKDLKRMHLACEVLTVNPAVRNLIREGKTYQIPNILQNNANDGMISMERSVAELVKKDLIEYDEAINRVNNINIFENFVKK